jgi:hypothetical protein
MDYLKYLFTTDTKTLQELETKEKLVKELQTKVKTLDNKLKKNWLERLFNILN